MSDEQVSETPPRAGKKFGEWTREERLLNLAKANKRKSELAMERKVQRIKDKEIEKKAIQEGKKAVLEAKVRASVDAFEASLPQAPPILVSDSDWREYQEQLRELTPKALLALHRLLDSKDERVAQAAIKEVLDRRWGKPASTIVQENVQREVTYSSSVLDAMKN